jgi:hypothetical protein
MTTGQKIAQNLFKNNLGETATRAQLRDEHRSIGRRSRNEVAVLIDEALAAEWPDGGGETRFVVHVAPNAGPSDLPEITAVCGVISDRFGYMVNDGAGAIGSDPAPGYYLLETARIDGLLRTKIIDFEPEVQRAERLARESGGAR